MYNLRGELMSIFIYFLKFKVTCILCLHYFLQVHKPVTPKLPEFYRDPNELTMIPFLVWGLPAVLCCYLSCKQVFKKLIIFTKIETDLLLCIFPTFMVLMRLLTDYLCVVIMIH